MNLIPRQLIRVIRSGQCNIFHLSRQCFSVSQRSELLSVLSLSGKVTCESSRVRIGVRGIMGDNNNAGGCKIDKEELKKKLTPMQYHVTQEKGTERPFSGIYNKTTEAGTYTCIVCSQPLFSSKTKFDSGCGWPAFNDVLDQGKVKLTKDTSNVGSNLLLLIANPGLIRTEVTCSQCDAHLGHVFNDGPPPTKRRFCINSASIDFIPAQGGGEKQ